MNLIEAAENRHSVRKYQNIPLSEEIKEKLQEVIAECNRESGLHIQIVNDEPKAFDGIMAHYGKFSGVSNYIALVGQKSADLDEKVGYYGEKIALAAQQAGLNTCWVALTFSKRKSRCRINPGEKLVCVLALGYGENQGTAHKSKPMDDLCKYQGDMPEWFKKGMDMAALAPTAMNQQKFLITGNGNQVKARATGGFYSKVDLGIVKYHFELGAGKDKFKWTK
ncbi:MAG: nitroreductase family protein [Ruminococcus sp.]|jgi:hypothetical protein